MAFTPGAINGLLVTTNSTLRKCLLAVLFAGMLLWLSSSSSNADEMLVAMGPSFAVQVGLYVGPIQSNRMAEQLTNAGYAAWVEERPQGQDKMLYFVLVGPFSDEAQAQDAVRSIGSKFNIQPFIIDLNKR